MVSDESADPSIRSLFLINLGVLEMDPKLGIGMRELHRKLNISKSL